MLKLTELRRHLQANPAFTLTTEAALQLIGIAEAAKRSEEHSKNVVSLPYGDEGFPELLLECVRL